MKEVTRLVDMCFSAPISRSFVVNLPFYLQTQGEHLSHERYISCFQGDRKRLRVSLLGWLFLK